MWYGGSYRSICAPAMKAQDPHLDLRASQEGLIFQCWHVRKENWDDVKNFDGERRGGCMRDSLRCWVHDDSLLSAFFPLLPLPLPFNFNFNVNLIRSVTNTLSFGYS